MVDLAATDAWIGADDIRTEGKFLWNTDYGGIEKGELIFNNWNSGEPNNGGGLQDCVKMNTVMEDINGRTH